MTIRIPRPVAIAAAVIAAIAVGVVGTLLLTGGNDDSDDGHETATQGQDDAFTASDLTGIDSADTSLNNSFRQLGDALTVCVGNDAAVVACFDKKYATYFATVGGVEAALDGSQSKAHGNCAIRLGEARPALASFKSASENFRQRFDAYEFDSASEGALVSNYNAYRTAMDKALIACADEVPGATATLGG